MTGSEDGTEALEPVAAAREEYTRGGLVESDLLPDPIAMFRRWYDDAGAAGVHEPNAMVVATVSADFAPASRLILLKGVLRGRLHRSTPTWAPGRAPSWPATHGSRCSSRGTRSSARSASTASRPGSRAATSTPTSPSGRAAPSSARGRRTSPGSSPAGRSCWRPTTRRSCASRAATSRPRRSGAATSCTPSRWSSGRAGRVGCTTDWSIDVRRRAGGPSVWPLDLTCPAEEWPQVTMGPAQLRP